MFFHSLLVFLLVLSHPQTERKHMITFLGMKDCPNTPPMWIALREALKEGGWDAPVERLDLVELAAKRDVRAGYGSPTILLNGKDLFGALPSGTYNPACRYYRGGVPGRSEILEKLRVQNPSNHKRIRFKK